MDEKKMQLSKEDATFGADLKRAAIEAIKSLPVTLDAETVQQCVEAVSNMSFVQPERKSGKWIKVNGKTAINCSACYHCSWSLSFEDTVKRFNFCPNCGADMRKDGEQDD